MLVKKMYKLTGIAPLLMRNGRLADPLDPIAKEIKKITAIRNKTEEDHVNLSRLEFEGSLYQNHDGKFIIPAEVLEAAIINGAKKRRRGPIFKSSMQVLDDGLLTHDGPKTVKKRFADFANCAFRVGVRVQSAKVMRTRPMFKTWALNVTVLYDQEKIDESEVTTALIDAGAHAAIGDYRPKYGRFLVEEL